MHPTPDIDIQLLQKGTLQPARHHRHIGHDTPTAQQRPNPDFHRTRGEKQLIDNVEIATRVNEALRHSLVPLGHSRPVTPRLYDPEALRFNGMRLIATPLSGAGGSRSAGAPDYAGLRGSRRDERPRRRAR